MKSTLSVCLSILWCSAAVATIPPWETLPECLRTVGQDLGKHLNSFTRCSNSESDEATILQYLAKVDEAEKNLRLIQMLLDQSTSKQQVIVAD